MYIRDKEKEKTQREFLYFTKWLPAYLAFIPLYPLGVEGLPGEILKWIKNYEGIYQISNYGRVKSFPRNGAGKKIKILVPVISMDGYLRVLLSKNNKRKNCFIHRLVAEAFISNFENKPHVNHKFGNKLDNYFENLEWTTVAENNQHAYNLGLKNPTTKLTDEQVEYIRRVYKPGDKEFGRNALARKFNIGISTIKRILSGKTYKNVE